MDDKHDAIDENSKQMSVIASSNIAQQIDSQIVSDFEPDPKSEITTLENASFDVYLSARRVQDQHPSEQLDVSADQSEDEVGSKDQNNPEPASESTTIGTGGNVANNLEPKETNDELKGQSNHEQEANNLNDDNAVIVSDKAATYGEQSSHTDISKNDYDISNVDLHSMANLSPELLEETLSTDAGLGSQADEGDKDDGFDKSTTTDPQSSATEIPVTHGKEHSIEQTASEKPRELVSDPYPIGQSHIEKVIDDVDKLGGCQQVINQEKTDAEQIELIKSELRVERDIELEYPGQDAPKQGQNTDKGQETHQRQTETVIEQHTPSMNDISDLMPSDLMEIDEEQDSQTEPEPVPERKPEQAPEPEPEPVPEATPEQNVQPEPEPSSEAEEEAKPEQNFEQDPKSEPTQEPELEPLEGENPEPELEKQSQPKPESEPELKHESELKQIVLDSKPQPESAPESTSRRASSRRMASKRELKPDPEEEPDQTPRASSRRVSSRRSALRKEQEPEIEHKSEVEQQGRPPADPETKSNDEEEPESEPEPETAQKRKRKQIKVEQPAKRLKIQLKTPQRQKETNSESKISPPKPNVTKQPSREPARARSKVSIASSRQLKPQFEPSEEKKYNCECGFKIDSVNVYMFHKLKYCPKMENRPDIDHGVKQLQSPKGNKKRFCK